MVCPHCSTESVAGQKFCAECGSALLATCPACAAEIAPNQKFCAECGAALGRTAPPTAATSAAPAASIAERRVVSVLFADLVGFTSLSESRDAEEVRELLSSYF
ncbi:MAG: double zinc ribbon domain-containing protein [Gaiellaceae bacterium]